MTWGVVGVVTVECLYALWTASRGYFWQDDFTDLLALHHIGFGVRLFEAPVFGHFIPGFTLVDYLISLIVPYQWWLIVVIEVFLFGLSLILLDRLLTILFGRSWLGVGLVAVAGASFSLVPSLVWWATALEYLVAIPATLLACILHVRYLQTRKVGYAIAGAVSLAVGFAFYDGLFVSVLFIILMTALFWPVGPGLRGFAQTLTAHSTVWACYLIPVGFEILWRFAHPGLYITGGSASLGQTSGFVGLSWTQTFVPLTFGIDTWVLPAHFERVAVGVLGQAILLGFVAYTILRRRSAWRAWVLLGSTFLFGATIVGVTRAGIYGPRDASDVKYVALDAFFLVIASGFALLPVRPLTTGPPPVANQARTPSDRSRGRLPTVRPAWFSPLVVLTLLAVVLAYGMVLIFDQDRDWESSQSQASHHFFAAFAASWASRASAANDAFLWDTEINPRVVTRSFFPFDTASATVGELHPQIRFDEWGGTGYLVRSDGSIVRATAVMQARGLVNERAACSEPQHKTNRVAITLDHRLDSTQRWFGLVSYRSTTGAVATGPGGATQIFPKGSGTLIAAFPPAPLRTVAWSLRPRDSLCVTGFNIVLPEPLRATGQQGSLR